MSESNIAISPPRAGFQFAELAGGWVTVQYADAAGVILATPVRFKLADGKWAYDRPGVNPALFHVDGSNRIAEQ